mmetsp:Transcript_9474/g.27016  ORF Transcript_9474/g.27016 Transcript_9474/m.27016 type:complete len:204 (-) Transcript_9474:429-1040(-)
MACNANPWRKIAFTLVGLMAAAAFPSSNALSCWPNFKKQAARFDSTTSRGNFFLSSSVANSSLLSNAKLYSKMACPYSPALKASLPRDLFVSHSWMMSLTSSGISSAGAPSAAGASTFFASGFPSLSSTLIMSSAIPTATLAARSRFFFSASNSRCVMAREFSPVVAPLRTTASVTNASSTTDVTNWNSSLLALPISCASSWM